MKLNSRTILVLSVVLIIIVLMSEPQVPSASASSIVRVQGPVRATYAGQNKVGDSFQVVLPNAPADGDALILTYGSNKGSSAVIIAITGVSETGASWTQQKALQAGSQFDDEIWMAPNVSGAGATITISITNFANKASIVVNVCEYSGLTVSPLDQTASNSNLGSSMTDTGTTPTTTQASELWVGGVAAGAGQSTPTNGFTLLDGAVYNGGTSNLADAYLEKIVSSTGAANSGTTLTTSTVWIGLMTTFKGVPTYTLNVDVFAADGSTPLVSASVTMTNSSGSYAQTVNSTGWVVYTHISDASVTFKIKWENSWVYGTVTQPMGANQTVTATAKVYLTFGLTWRYNDNSTAFTPTQAQVTAPNGTLITLSSSYTLGKVQNGTWTVNQVEEWGNNVVPATNPTFSATAKSQSKQVPVQIYSRTLAFKYNDGSTPFSPTNVTYTAPNGTLYSRTSYSNIIIQNGTSTYKTIMYWNRDVIPTPSPTFDAATGNPSTSVRVYHVTPAFNDAGGVVLYSPPSSYKNTAPNGTLSGSLVPGSAYWIQNGTSTVSAVTWEGTNITPAASTFDASSGNPAVNTKVHSLTTQAIDQSNNKIVVGDRITFPNSTQITVASNSTGGMQLSQVQDGSYTLDLFWNGLLVNSSLAQTVSSNLAFNFTGSVYFTSTNGFEFAVDQGTASGIVGTQDVLSFTASASGSHTVKVYVGAKGAPVSVSVDGVLQSINVGYTYDPTTELVSIPLTFTTHSLSISWIVSNGGQNSGTLGGTNNILPLPVGVSQVANQTVGIVNQVVAAAQTNPWLAGGIMVFGLLGGSGLAYRDDRRRLSYFLAGMSVFFALDALFFWNILPVAALQTNLGFLPVTIDRLLIPIPTLQVPTQAPTGQQIASSILEIAFFSLTVGVIAFAATSEE